MEAIIWAVNTLGGGLVGLAVLVTARLLPLFVVAPWFGPSVVPLTIRIALLLGVSALLTPLILLSLDPALIAAPRSAVVWLGLGLKELLLGALIALMGSAVLWGAQTAGGMIDRLRGHPTVAPEAHSPLGRLTVLLAAALFVVSGGHLLVIAVLARSFQLVGPFALPNTGLDAVVLGPMVRTVGELFVLAAALALPVAVVLALADITLAFLDRLAPHLRGPLGHLSLRAVLGLVVALATLRLALDTAVGGTVQALRALEGLLGGLR
ncbi:MAG: flagellar biosynthetic protein FliR [Myxococcota bacterium]